MVLGVAHVPVTSISISYLIAREFMSEICHIGRIHTLSSRVCRKGTQRFDKECVQVSHRFYADTGKTLSRFH